MQKEQARTHLRAVSILSPLSDVELDAFAGALRWRNVSRGEEIVSHLSQGAQVFFVAEGLFRVRLDTTTGRTVAIRELRAGAHFGELAALTNAPRSVTVVAEAPGLLAECPAEAFRALMASHAGFAAAVAAALARTVVSLTDRVFELSAVEVRFRVQSELLRLARAGTETKEGILIREAPTHDMIAASIGTHREAVTRELRYLTTQNIIRHGRREIVLLQPERLKALVQRRTGVTATQLVDWAV